MGAAFPVIRAVSTVIGSPSGRLLTHAAGVLVLLLGLTLVVFVAQTPAHGHTVQKSVADTRDTSSDRADSIPVKSRDGETDATERGSRRVSAIDRAEDTHSSASRPRAGLSGQRGLSPASHPVTDRETATPTRAGGATLLADAVADGRLMPAASDRRSPAMVPPTVTSATTAGDAVAVPRRDVVLLVSVALNAVLGLLIIVHRHGSALASRLRRWLPGRDGPGQFGESDATDAVSFDDPSVPDSQLVVALLERNDYRLRQSAIVERTGWSKAKVSRLLGEMASRDLVVKVPLGRQNLICLAGHEPDIVKPRTPE